MTQGTIRRTHFVGIGGTGMCGLAEILLNLGYKVSGSDLVARSEVIDRLKRLGAEVHAGHAAEHVTGADLVVISSAVAATNPEVRAARELGIPVLKRGQMLAEIMRMKYGVAVAGAHGKTTTTSLTGHVLSEAGLDPTVVVGGRLRALGSHARVGAGDVFVAEADESDGSFLEILPTVAVITNIDREHLDHYKDLDEIYDAFLRFARSVPFYGAAILCGDDPRLRQMAAGLNKPVLLYGTEPGCHLRATAVHPGPQQSRFEVEAHGRSLGEFTVPLPGRHNVLNALAAIAVALFVGVPAGRVRRGLSSFAGVGRRFEIRGEARGITLVDDYGHHPTEIAAVLRTAREAFPTRRLVVMFQPHRYSRTAALREEFSPAFRGADILILTDIYSAGEAPIEGVTGQILGDLIHRGSRVAVEYAPREEDAIERALAVLEPGDVLITLGAGSVSTWGEKILARLERDRGPGTPGGHAQGCAAPASMAGRRA
ncbi:MAG: UDP-N-acetylmuramate--L-alanine ligase [Candidatus Eisenbacteria bacterium]|nr:UDP-N-acetylmuramate--L-alanine ligase [Candidatus Eisenbacteria bacterium]